MTYPATKTSMFGTKAETLERFQPSVKASHVPDLYYFSAAEWREDPEAICDNVQAKFGKTCLAIRSSAYNEDTATQSHAGAYQSILNVDGADRAAIQDAVEQVMASYESSNPLDQVLVQAMLGKVKLSGVIMTHDLSSGAPYYIINYDDESGKTDVITGGTGVNKTVVVHHNARQSFIESARVRQLLELTRELETLCGERTPLDIEFAQTADGQMHLLQVRRIAVQKNWNRAVRTRLSEALENLEQFLEVHASSRPGLAGHTTILGQMPDWNPAELIGTLPMPLSVSLFRFLITDSVWQEARALMGYRSVPDEPLLISLAGRPYIDVRNSFNSFLPAGLEEPVENALIDAWLARLAQHPEFHDKVEFEVAQTVFDFAFEQNFDARYGDVLSAQDREIYADLVRKLTVRNVTPRPDGSLALALQQVAVLRKIQENQFDKPYLLPLRRAKAWLQEVRQYGSLQFSMIARHAFMAETLLRSAVQRSAWSAERLGMFKRSISTVAGEMGRDFARVMKSDLSREAFLQRYGHLRPGTFDIMSPRYDQREDLFRDTHFLEQAEEIEDFSLLPSERSGLMALLVEIGLPITPEELLLYARQAIAGREYSKFVFTKHLSDSMEALAEWGEHIGLVRDDLMFLTLSEMLDTLHAPLVEDQETHFHELAEARRIAIREMRGLRLGYIIRDPHDLYVVPLHRGLPNFVTTRSVEAQVVLLDNRMAKPAELFNKIVCIESADPGFDWIFTKGIAGLVTKFGGANSHMTIRCAELGLPAAIGVGEQTFERLSKADRIELRCGEKLVRPIYG